MKDWITKKINSRLIFVIKDALILCIVCGLIAGLCDFYRINKYINNIVSIFDNCIFEINDNSLKLSSEDQEGYVGDIQYYITDKKSLSDGQDLKESKIDSVNYLLILKDGIQCNAGIVGMNNYLDSQKGYGEIFKGEYVDNDTLIGKLKIMKILASVVIILGTIMFDFSEFLVQVIFIAALIYCIARMINKKQPYTKILKEVIYLAVIPKLIMMILQCISGKNNFQYIMLFILVLYLFTGARKKHFTNNVK